MNVKVTFYLKSGGEISQTWYDTNLEEQTAKYAKVLERGLDNNVICLQSSSEVTFIPIPNLASLRLKELP